MSDTTRDRIKSDAPPCDRCGHDVHLLTILPRASDHPTFRIFGCARCSFIRWVAEAGGEA
jgi:hypothetical protein